MVYITEQQAQFLGVAASSPRLQQNFTTVLNKCKLTSKFRELPPSSCYGAVPTRLTRYRSSHAQQKEGVTNTNQSITNLIHSCTLHLRFLPGKKNAFLVTKLDDQTPPLGLVRKPTPSADSLSHSSTRTFSVRQHSLSEDNTASAQALSAPSDRRRGSYWSKVSMNFHVR